MKKESKAPFKLLPAIAPSVGDYKELAKRLRNFFNTELKNYKRACIRAAKEYKEQSTFDAGDNAFPFEVYINELIERQFRASAKAAQKEVQTIALDARDPPYMYSLKFAEAAARYRIEFTNEKARDVSYWFCRKLLRNVNHRMKRQLKAAGISTAWLAKRWTIPYIGGQSVPPAVAAGLPDYIAEIANLITKMSAKSHAKVQDALIKGLAKGMNVQDLVSTLNKLEHMDSARALRVARDQSCKLNQFVQRENYKSIGVSYGQWQHIPGQFSSRYTHKYIMNGQNFDLKKGCFDPEVNRDIQPGELPYCRCTFRAILPDFLLRDI